MTMGGHSSERSAKAHVAIFPQSQLQLAPRTLTASAKCTSALNMRGDFLLPLLWERVGVRDGRAGQSDARDIEKLATARISRQKCLQTRAKIRQLRIQIMVTAQLRVVWRGNAFNDTCRNADHRRAEQHWGPRFSQQHLLPGSSRHQLDALHLRHTGLAHLPKVIFRLLCYPRVGMSAILNAQPSLQTQCHCWRYCSPFIEHAGQGGAGNSQLPGRISHRQSQCG